MKSNNVRKRKKSIRVMLLSCLMLLLSNTIYLSDGCVIKSQAHSGRTDSSGGHKDNKNASGLGYYHYHCGGNPPHLHDGVCPYSGGSSSYDDTTAKPKAEIKVKSTPSEMSIGDAFSPEYELNNATDTTLHISSSDSSVVRVSNVGTLRAVGEGKATIMVESSEASAQYTIVVKSVPLESISFREDSIKIQLGEKSDLSVDIKPSNATNKDISYASENDKIVSCTSKEIEGKEIGKTNITATAENGMEAKVAVEVYEVFPEEIKTNKEEIKLETTQTDQLSVEILPENANNKDYSYSVTDENIISIDQDGNIKPLAFGNTSIIIETHNNIKKEIPVEVYYIKVEEIIIDNENDYLDRSIDINEGIDFTVNILPENATNKEYEIISNNEDILKVENNKINIVGTGKAELSFMTHDEVMKTVELKIVNEQMNAIILLSAVMIVVIVVLIIKNKAKTKKLWRQ